MDKMMMRLEGMEERYNELNSLLMDTELMSDPKRYAKIPD